VLVFALGQYKTSVQKVTPQATVLVSTAQITKGTSGDLIATQKLYKATPIVATQLTPGAISDASLLEGKVAAATILPGQQLTLADFTTVVGITGVLPPAQRALSVSIDEAHGNTDVLQAGDRVDLYAEFAAPPHGSFVVLIAPKVLIIKTAGGAATVSPSAKPGTSTATTSTPATTSPTAASPTGGTTLSGSAMVLSVSAAEAPEIVFAANAGALYVSLRPANATTSPRSLTTLASIEQASISTSGALSNGAHP
jgi:Flp pilus assembly protein CpaB